MAEQATVPAASGYTDPPPFSAEAQGPSLTFFPAGKDRRDALLELVASARKTLDVCFYIFAEDKVSTSLRDALCEAASRGVDVTLIIDRFGASAKDEFLKPLSEAGGRYHYFSPRLGFRYLIRNHQKMVIADGERAMFGSANVDERSMRHNEELSIVAFDPDLVAVLDAHYEEDITKAEVIDLERWRDRPIWKKWAEAVVDPFEDWM